MISFPILDRLDVSDYGLYPGPNSDAPGLHINFKTGLTLILGANGLGKTTLVTIIFRLLTGPNDIPGLSGRTDLGNLRLATTVLSNHEKTIFSRRVVDGARSATARLDFKLGSRAITIARRLSDLALVKFEIDAQSYPSDEASFQKEILSLVGVWSFGDWILLLRHLVFYFEDRRALIWDPSAQRQILRFLFLQASTAQQWTESERAILELDSRMRNLNAALTREERALATNEYKVKGGTDIRQELKSLQNLQEIDHEMLEQYEQQVVEVEATRQNARLRLLKSEQEREARFRELERAKLTAIGSRFPDRSETARYILAQLMTEHSCLVCDHVSPDAAAKYNERIDQKHCVVCNSDLSIDSTIVPSADVADRRVEKARTELEAIEVDLATARRDLIAADDEHRSHFEYIQALNTATAERSRKIDGFIRLLPPAESELHQQRSDLASLRRRVEELRAELTAKRSAFREFVEAVSRQLASQSESIMKSFDSFAEGFLLETCHLVWAPHRARVGETGELFDFPAFELEMTGADFPSPVRRNGPEQVSESQREFIDLAFRMALMAIAGNLGSGTLVIDAPESSLDAVFVTRAADVLSKFGSPGSNNRLLITSNLVEGRLIPSLVQKCIPRDDSEERVVDLFAIAAPTAAVRQLRAEYDRIRMDLVGPQVGTDR